MAALAVAVKCLWSFEGGLGVLAPMDHVPLPNLDWKRWMSGETASSSASQNDQSISYASATVNDVLGMSANSFDGYLRHVMSFLEDDCEMNPESLPIAECADMSV